MQRGQLRPGDADDAVELVRLELAHERPQHADQRREGQLTVAQLDAVADEHARPLRPRPDGELAQQPRLADTRLAGDQHRPRAAGTGGLERRFKRLQLGRATNEHGA